MGAAPLPASARSPSRILIVEDSAVARAVIGRVIGGSERFTVTGAVANVRAALDFLGGATVEYILLDINLPGVDGITALPDLLAAGGDAKVLIVSSAAVDGAAQAIRALALGAADTLEKPATGEMSARFGAALIEKLERLGEAAADPILSTTPPRSRRSSADAYDVVAIGASTGGIHALSKVLRELPASFVLPVLVTQHLPATFMPYFAAQIALIAGRPCEVATDRLRIRPGRIVVAPGDAHLCVASLGDGTACVRLSQASSPSNCLPSVDAMLGSVAGVFGSRAMGVVLTGMGRDGAEGARALRDAGGAVVVQDRESAVVWGMPGAIAAAGIADAILPPDAIGRLVAERRRP